jgi:membrane protease YdiL (CAAX protease family)
VNVFDQPAPKFAKAITLLLMAPVILFVLSIGFYSIKEPRPPVPFMLMAAEATLFLSLVSFLKTDDLGFKSIGWLLPEGKRSLWLEPLLGFAAAVPIFIFTYYVTVPVAVLGQKIFGGFQLESLTAAPTVARFVFSLIFAPIVEESVFRGYAIAGIRPRLGPVWALIISSLFFGLFHFGYGFWGMFQLAVTGLLYGLVFLWRKNLPASIFSHALVNLLLLLVR